MTDPIADMLSRIRNAVMVQKPTVVVTYSTIKFEIAKILKREGFIDTVEKAEAKPGVVSSFEITLRYRGKESAIRGLTRVSKPGNRVYKHYRDIPKVLPSLGALILSTSEGLITNTEAREKQLGGEVLCEIY